MKWTPALKDRPGRALCVALVLATIAFLFQRAGFHGGLTDDQQYLDAGQAWFDHAPVLGKTHWALRHPLVLAIAGLFSIGGPDIATAMVVPMLYALLFAGAGFATLYRLASPRAAWLWLALVLVNPIVHEMGTSLFPEIAELALGTAGLGVVWLACRRAGPQDFILSVAGVLFGLAFLTRETAVLLGPIVAMALWANGKGLRGMVMVALGGLIPVAADAIFLHAASGDWLYRFHVDSAHTEIASAHLKGGTFNGRVFFNPDLAARWIPAGPARVHWALNPLLDFLIDLRFGLLIAGWALAHWLFARSDSKDRGVRRAALALAILSYLGVCWALMLRPQPRYFLFVVLAASVAVALMLDAAWNGPRRRWAIALFSLLVVAGLFGVFRQQDHERLPRLVSPYLNAHPGIYHSDRITARRVNEWLEEERSPSRLVDTPAQPGDLVLRRDKYKPPAGEERVTLAVIDGKGMRWWERRGFKAPRPMIVEKRVR